jgi:predicted GH43/DUF377 family glycosyl hydrolase
VTPPDGLFTRHPHNPILTAERWPSTPAGASVQAVFNPAATTRHGTTVLVCRVEDSRGHSHLWAAHSHDGTGSWTIDPAPLLSPRPDVEAECWGVEDARLVHVAELGRWVMTCTAYGPRGPAVYLATTDLHDVFDIEQVMPPEDKNAVLFPRRFDGEWIMLHRPVTTRPGSTADVWLSRSADLVAWRRPARVLQARQGAWWDSLRIGAGPPPIETADGWLLIYHGVRATVAGDLYRVGLALLDLDEPTRVLARSDHHVLSPQAPYERIGDVPNVVFPTGATVDGNELRLYYGAADTTVALATARLDEIMAHLASCPPG